MDKQPEIDVELIKRVNKRVERVILASQSENRLLLLKELGLDVISMPQDTDESCDLTNPEEVVKTLSRKKLDSYISSSSFNDSLIAIALDTLVLFDNKLLGKPRDIDEARLFLNRFSANRQEVLTGMSIYLPNSKIITTCDSSYVYFRALSESEIESYLESGEFMGAAGGYRIQKSGYKLVDKIIGSWTNVIGFPLEEFVRVIEENNIMLI